MSLTDVAANGGRKPLREGFIRSEGPREPEPAPPAPAPLPPEPPSSALPQQPLPSQRKLEQPPPEAPISEFDELRKGIAAAAESWPITVQLLYKPIKNDRGEEVTALTFREPRASEINRIGNPVRLNWENEAIIEERKMTYIMAALCGILPPTLEQQMDPRDWNSCAYRLRKFFLPDMRAW